MATYLIQKPGESTWYVRMAVPADVRKAFGGRTKLIKTTGTSNKAEAMNRRLPILAQWKSDIAAAREQKLAAREQWRPELADGAVKLGHQIDAHLLDAAKNPPKGLGGTAAEVYARSDRLDQEIQEFLHQAQRLEELGASGLVDRIKADFHFAEAEETTMVDSVLRSGALVQEVIVQLAERKHRLSPLEAAEAREIVKSPATYKPVSPITDRRLETFRTQRVKEGIAQKTIDQQESKLKKLSDYLRDQGKPLTNETVAAWLETLSVTSKTKAQYLLAGSTFWQWAMKNDAQWKNLQEGLENPFKEQALPKVRGRAKVEAARKAFTTEQIESLYKVALGLGNQTLCDLIELGAHTGCRIEELAQLRQESVMKVEGVLSFKIEDSKTAAGIREIPVHPAIQTTVERLIKDSADGFLLPASSGNKYGIRSDSLSKAFGRLKTAEGFGKHHVFHSVRAMVVTLLLRAGVVGPTVANIVGHETGLVTFDVYDEGASPEQKLNALNKLSYSFKQL
ncbi:DUF6538 domain-containing protein [Pseudomonas plecoglossicida]|uniref:DUF6538 domain-containing protein n=1 Tax=Pseudomonas plecoglossicida TaxID=70775 RepID=UPI000490F255|nr:DUF6538 domain-containing protein [Pseudomonas plecoglossicida]GLR38715.1 hypothetical protein GCM10011247_41140 [Pseudomonas plecoglossicida]